MIIKALDYQNKLVEIPQAELDILSSGIKGELMTPKDKGYDEACTLWNAMIDKNPAFIVRSYGANTKRLAEIKSKYDPNNVLRGNLNITPRD